MPFPAAQATRRATVALYALVSYVPMLATKPGMITADTKAYLYLDPGRLTVSAASMWDPSIGMGTVTHQNIGYLFPMGPYYWLVETIGLPVWVGQRIWMGSLIFLAGLGVRYCCRQLGLTDRLGLGAACAGLVYMLTPYTIDYIARSSALVMPWAGFGWMIGLTILAARRGGWRYPALFALIILLVGGVNATSVSLVCLGPVLWLVYAAFGREVSWKQAWAAAWRIAVLSVVVSLWWVMGLLVEAAYGYNVLAVTESITTVTSTTSASEVLRGLGYWYFYGQDKVQPWTEAAVGYMESMWLIAVSFTLPALALLAAAVARWRYRAYAVGLIFVGTVIAVAMFPYNSPSPFGAILKAGSEASSSLGLAMRSTDRVVPLVVLGMALLLGSAVAALLDRVAIVGVVAAVTVVGIAAADMPPLWSGDLVASNLDYSHVPGYWHQAADYLQSQGSSTRVLGLPGEDFAAYRWGATEDQIPPGLMSRPYAQEQVVPQGEPGSVDLLESLDEQLVNGTLQPSAIAPVARLMSAGDLLVQNDLQYERYQLPLPQTIAKLFQPDPGGLGGPKSFGTPSATKPIKYPLYDEEQLGLPTGDPQPAPLTDYPVDAARPIVRSEAASAPLIIAGNGSGVVNAGAQGLLAGNPTVLYSASLDKRPGELHDALASGAGLVVTDTNQDQGQRWGSIVNNYGPVQEPGVSSSAGKDPGNYVNPLFPGQTSADQTVAQLNGGVQSVQASSSGSTIDYTPEDQPSAAVDGDPQTAWSTSPGGSAVGQFLRINLDNNVTADHINLSQVQNTSVRRTIKTVTLTFDGKNPVTEQLGPQSLTPDGQQVNFPSRSFKHLDVKIDATAGQGASNHFDAVNAVGFSTVQIPGVAPTKTTLRMPTDLLGHAGAASQANPLTILMDRIQAPYPPRSDPETDISRQFDLPTDRTFTLAGTANISYTQSDAQIEAITGALPPPQATASGSASSGVPIVGASSSGRLINSLNTNAIAAVDGNPQTAWVTEQGNQNGSWLSYQLARPVNFDHLDLQVVNDGRHSLPTQAQVSTPSGVRTVNLPPIPVGTGRPQGAVTSVPISFPALNGNEVKVNFTQTKPMTQLNYYANYTNTRSILPLGIAEVGIPGVAPPQPPQQIPTTCRSDLLTVDGHPLDVQVSGTYATAMSDGQLRLSPCGNSAGGVALPAGSHNIQAASDATGFDVNALSLSSAAGGGPQAVTPSGQIPTVPTSPAPAVHVTHSDRTNVTAKVAPSKQPTWFVLGQSESSGWNATLNGKSLGRPMLIDGYANGWLLPAGALAKGGTVRLEWAPQNAVWAALGASGAGVVITGVLAWLGPPPDSARPRRRKGRKRLRRKDSDEGAPRRLAARLGPPAPQWRSPLTPSPLERAGAGQPARWRGRTALAVAVACGLVSWLFSAPAVGGVVAAATLAALLVPKARPVLRLGGVVAAVAVMLTVMVEQSTHRYYPEIQWVGYLTNADVIGWLAVCLLAADAVVELVSDEAGR